jgi:hypothetical protein
MAGTIVCDIDGTLVDRGRTNVALCQLLRILQKEHPVVFLTGRTEYNRTYQELTSLGLRGDVCCRPEDRKREPPHFWKLEKLALLKNQQSILMLVDDDPKMQEGARVMGISVV